MPAEEQKALKILFNCECSDALCVDRISLTLKEFDEMHNSKARFVIKKDHIEPSVEKIHKSSKQVTIVEKFAL